MLDWEMMTSLGKRFFLGNGKITTVIKGQWWYCPNKNLFIWIVMKHLQRPCQIWEFWKKKPEVLVKKSYLGVCRSVSITNIRARPVLALLAVTVYLNQHHAPHCLICLWFDDCEWLWWVLRYRWQVCVKSWQIVACMLWILHSVMS